jgi:hypothetical protein
VSQTTPKQQAKLAAEKSQKGRFHRIILIFAPET